MALFKILKGLSTNLPSTYKEGFCYFTTDDGKMYIDTTSAAGGRVCLNAAKADKLKTARTITLSGDVSGSVSFDGSQNVTMTTTVADNSHNHTIAAEAAHDSIVVLTGTNGINKVKYEASHAKKGPSAGYTSGNTTTSISGSGGSGTIKIPQLTVDAYGHVTAAADENVTITMPTTPNLSGGSAATADATVVGGVTVSGHTITVGKKTLTAGSNVTITGAADKITIASTNTDTKVTAVGNHYAPTADANAVLSVDASSTTSATWGTTDLVTGVNIQRDAKGHVTGVTVDSIQMPANPNIDTKVTQTITTSNANYPLLLAPANQGATATTSAYFDSGVTLNPSTNTIAANISGNAATATKATQDGSGNVITSKYVTLDTVQTISGVKTFTGGLSINTNTGNAPLVISRQGDSGQKVDIYQDDNFLHFDITNDEDSAATVFNYNATDTESGKGNAHTANIEMGMSNNGTTYVKANNFYGNASTATKLATARTIQTNLASTSTASFDGSANITPGVTGTLGVANGGTGVSSHTTNRLVWSTSATQIQAAYHYANGTKIGINYTSEPSTNFYVNGTSAFRGNITIPTDDTDRFISFENGTGFGWRIGYLGTGAGDANYLAIQSDGPSAGTYSNALRFGLTTLDAAFGGNVYPLVNNTKTLGTSSYKWNNVYATTFTGNLSGNASTATSATQLSSNSRMDYGWNGVNYFNFNGTQGNAAKANDAPTSAWWHILRFNHANNSGYYTDLAIPFNANSLYYKRISGGSVQNGGWVKVLDTLNYTDYTVTKTGTGASGTWGINIIGNAATATKATQDGNGNTIASTYLKLSGGTMTGAIKRTASAGVQLIGWGSDTDVNANNVPWYSFSLYDGGSQGSHLCISNYWGIDIRTSDNTNLTHNGRRIVCDGDNFTGNSASVTKLQTARTIFGKSFDGTANVEGQPLVYGTYTSTAANRFSNSGIQIRENGLVGSAQSDIGYAPSIGFHWGGKIAATMLFHSDGNFYLRKQDGVTRASLDANLIGNASTATALTTSAGSSTRPVYFSSGKPVQCGTSLGVSITGNSATATRLKVTDSPGYTTGCYYYQGQPTIGTSTGNCYEGSSNNYNLWSYPASGTASDGTVSNVQTLRLMWGSTYWSELFFSPNQDDIYHRCVMNGTAYSWKKIWESGDSVTGAVWNDYAECRESDCEEFGYVLMEVGDDSLTKTTERLSHFAGVSSDTWGFSQGETDKAKTPIAVAGRVLVYPYQDRNNYKPGDCVCAAPGGTVDIMTREEVINWPDRIVGTVSCVPDYEEWGGGEMADRPAVKVNGRIWIKVK